MHGADNYIDVKIKEMISKGQVQAYVVDPPLANVSQVRNLQCVQCCFALHASTGQRQHHEEDQKVLLRH